MRLPEQLARLRQAFPQPVSDRVHDAYFVFSILRALDKVDALKGATPMLGEPVDPDWQAARAARLPAEGAPLEEVATKLVERLSGMFIWGHPRSQINVICPPSIASIIGVLLPSIYNPNLCSEETGRRFSEAEVEAAAMAADLVGYDPERSAGVFTFGGTGALLYAIKVGLEKALPGVGERGLATLASERQPPAIFASAQSHYACANVASWLGLGQANVVRVPTHLDNSIQLPALEKALRQALEARRPIAGVVATMGTTDAFGIDDLAGIRAMVDRLAEEYRLEYRPHVHADAVIGWAWSVFNDYDCQTNPLGFRGRTVRALAAASHRIRHLRLADSIGIDFHKTGYAPYVSSLALFRQRDDLARIARQRAAMPYLFQSGEHHPGQFTLETSRSGSGPMAALANLLLFGRSGLQALLGHSVEMAEALREGLEAHPDTSVLNGDNVGPVTLFRVYPHGIDTFTAKDRERTDPAYRETTAFHNDYNRRIFRRVHDQALAGDGVVISMTDCYRETDYGGQPIAALKSYILSPFVEEQHVQSVIAHVLAAREAVDAELRAEGK